MIYFFLSVSLANIAVSSHRKTGRSTVVLNKVTTWTLYRKSFSCPFSRRLDVQYSLVQHIKRALGKIVNNCDLLHVHVHVQSAFGRQYSCLPVFLSHIYGPLIKLIYFVWSCMCLFSIPSRMGAIIWMVHLAVVCLRECTVTKINTITVHLCDVFYLCLIGDSGVWEEWAASLWEHVARREWSPSSSMGSPWKVWISNCRQGLFLGSKRYCRNESHLPAADLYIWCWGMKLELTYMYDCTHAYVFDVRK